MALTTENTEQGDAHAAIFTAAKQLFAERGFGGVSVRQIAAAAGVHFALVRYYFGDKTGLYKACLRRYGECRLACADVLIAPLHSVEDFERRLHSALAALLENQLADPCLTKMFLREVEAREPLADDVLGDTVIIMAKRFVAYFKAAQKVGIIRPDVDPQILTHMIQGIINHFVRTDAVRKRHFGFSIKDVERKAELLRTIMQLLLHGALKGPDYNSIQEKCR